MSPSDNMQRQEFVFATHQKMKKSLFKTIAKLNKIILPSYTKKQLDLSKASKIQLAIIGWRAYITMNALDKKKTTDW